MKILNSVLAHAFRVVLLFFLVFIWVRFYQKNLWLAVVYSALISFLIDVVVCLLGKRKGRAFSLKKEEILRAEGFANHFVFSPKSTALNFFQKLLAKTVSVQKRANFLWWQSGEVLTVFYPFFTFDRVKICDLFQIYHSIKLPQTPGKIIVCGAVFDRETEEFVKNIPVKFVLLDQYQTYEKLMKPNGVFPDKNLQIKPTKKGGWRAICEYALNRKRAKTWLFSACLLVFSSFFVRVSVYYLLISSLLLVLGIVSFSNRRFNQVESENLL